MVDISKIETELEELRSEIKVLSSSRDAKEVNDVITRLKAEIRIRELSIAYLDIG